MKTRLIFATVIYILLLLMAIAKQKSSIIKDSLILGSTLFYVLYAISIITNKQNITKKN